MRTDDDIERGKELRAQRAKLGLSRPAVARELGVHRNTVLGWEKGRMPYDGHAEALTRLYNLRGDFFRRPELSPVPPGAIAELRDNVATLTEQMVQVNTKLDAALGAQEKRSPIEGTAPSMPDLSDEEPEDKRKRKRG